MSGPPPRRAFTSHERAVVDRHRTPAQVQEFLHTIRYNHHRVGRTLRSFRQVLREGEFHCMEAALVAAVMLEQHGYPPLLVSLESQDDLDHVLFVYRRRGRWGSVARSRDAGLHGRRPVFRSIRNLVWSYYDPYVDFTGRITGYALVNLWDVGNYDWRFNAKNMWWLERYLIDLPHMPLPSSDTRYHRLWRRFTAFRRAHPDGPADYYQDRERWVWPGRRRWTATQLDTVVLPPPSLARAAALARRQRRAA